MLDSIVRYIIPGLWLAWFLYWMGAARNVKATRWREHPLSQLVHRALLVLAVVLMIGPYWSPAILNERILPWSTALFALGTLMLAAGLGFSIWARRHLGRNWSADVTLKEDHALIRTGPYNFVRHPIYSGILFAILGTAVAMDEWRGVGTALLRRLIACASGWDDVQRLTLTVVERAHAARALYRAVGFELFGRELDGLRQDGVSDTVEYLVLRLPTT